LMSTPRAMTTKNINKQQQTKIMPAQQRRKRRGGATRGECGGSALRYDFSRGLW
jgi:hypothetical protein